MKKINKEYTLEDFNYNLPKNLIAQNPAESRDESRLFVIQKNDGRFIHSDFKSIANFLQSGDTLVFNNTKVINGRIFCTRESGEIIEVVLTQQLSVTRWLIITNSTKKLKVNDRIYPTKNKNINFIITNKFGEIIEIITNVELSETILSEIGEVPLPPYIKRAANNFDIERYQTIYAENSGAVAAPTAGLHFTDEIFSLLKEKEIESIFITLHVSWGTFSPVRDNDLSKHKMHTEKFILDNYSAERINLAREEGRRIVAVGTTSLRVLESTFKDGKNIPEEGTTDIFIYPPYSVKSVDALLTNLHTPKSTLLMLVASFAGYELIMNAYKAAVEMEYRFFSYGDAMLII
ncbi:MAG: tRNA preQ1(34) S-adenosylmethionine ribosyltransferase-isomerase QueA [Leptospirales bacterium]|nr:tRNA preQ1(34) S-adenosylmethionine ribosyltransferase-isomerase QueA [Leptospirales bacterium]